METTEKRKKFVTIESGNFTPNGNYSAYDDERERYHLQKSYLETLGWSSDKDVKYPFYATVTLKPIGQFKEGTTEAIMNEDGTPYTVDRWTVTKVYNSRQEYIENEIDKQSVSIEIAVGLKGRATKAGLDEKTVNALLASI